MFSWHASLRSRLQPMRRGKKVNNGNYQTLYYPTNSFSHNVAIIISYCTSSRKMLIKYCYSMGSCFLVRIDILWNILQRRSWYHRISYSYVNSFVVRESFAVVLFSVCLWNTWEANVFGQLLQSFVRKRIFSCWKLLWYLKFRFLPPNFNKYIVEYHYLKDWNYICLQWK